ncbi:hypothetical protein HMPREF1982_04557 [Clostridiales bacterium oral taxon 876 str. F0540]|nr:hypothetical protein HMPREF1982_04557 [Clostridiales bacterium oral taxon 876 str. F0540]
MSDQKIHEKANRLVNEKSPYLLQHAYNPVDWYPWSDEAFAKAKAEDKPIFLSVGYSTCHWCHVMERESFEDEEVAELLNKYFISIKVDKEERPDIDSIYMTVCQALTGSGGWPMTILMTPDKKPFYAGTYFPKKSKYGRPGLMDVLFSVEEAWRTKKSDLISSSEEIVKAIGKPDTGKSKNRLSRASVKEAYKELKDSFDPVYGGIGEAPKFPIPHNLLFLMRYYYLYEDKKALEIVEKTLEGMYKGGIFDHVGFGFSRYSVDRKWLVPHFEKMLYDNALLAIAYTEAYQITRKELYKETTEKIFKYILEVMTSEEGGFYCAEDADSEGVEGKFYVWDLKEVLSVLGEKEGKIYCDYYNITERGNFEGKSIPNLIAQEIYELENDKDLKDKLDKAREKLFNYRDKRVHPHKDDKILTSWNGLMIAAFAYAGRVFGKDEYTEAAIKAVRFILEKLVNSEGRLLARYRDKESAHLAYLEDYAFLIWGLIELYENTLDKAYLDKAVNLNKEMIKQFWDEKEGGFYLYSKDAEELIIRPKEVYDGAIPSGNSVAALNLIRLSRLAESREFEEMAEKQFEVFGRDVQRMPSAHSLFMIAFLYADIGGKAVAAAGYKDDKKIKLMKNEVDNRYLPFTTFALKEDDLQYKMVEDKAAAYICQNFSCSEPVTDLEEFKNLLDFKSKF